MKLLIVTQTIDTESPTLGFFHRWVEEFAKHCESVVVICLQEGKHQLPENVRVLSLGKDWGASRLTYLRNFYSSLWKERKNYDVVFVHMNQEYVLLGALLWRMLGKKVTLWRNHYAGSWLTQVACLLSHSVFYTSRASYTATFANAVQMPVGVDEKILEGTESIERVPRSVLFLGRVAPSKNPELFIEALGILKERGAVFTASLYGPSEDEQYVQGLKEKARARGISEMLTFGGAVPYEEVGSVFAQHQIYVNLAQAGMYDKTLFEAALCGCTVLCVNDEAPFTTVEPSATRIADGIETALTQGVADHAVAARTHTLAVTIQKLVAYLSS